MPNSGIDIESALSSTRWVFEFLTPESTPATLKTALCAELPHIDADSWDERLEFGGLFLNGERVYSDRPLPTPCRIEYFEPKYDFRRASSYFPEFDESWVLYDDGALLAVYKPPGLPTIANKDQRSFNLKSYLERHFGHRVHLPSRLDSSTAGLIVASKSGAFHGHLQRLFERHLIDKFYLLEVLERPRWDSTTVTAAVARSSNHAVLRRATTEGGLPAITGFTVAQQTVAQKIGRSSDSRTLLIAKPKTGRTHQIRVHISSEGHPIVGDRFYGGMSSDSGLHLLSFGVALVHPLTTERVWISLPERLFPSWLSSYSSGWQQFFAQQRGYSEP